MKIRSGLIAAVFLAGGAALSASTLANTQVGVSNLSFHVETGLVDLTTFVLDTGGDLFNYDPTTGEAHFAVAALPEVIDGQAVYDEPFFCFEGGNPSVGLSATDANGHVIAENIHAGGNLEYLPVAGAITLSPASSSYCFYKNKDGSDLGPLGLFGVPPQNEEDEQDPEELFSDSFESKVPAANLEITYRKDLWNDFPDTAEHEDFIDYELVVRNTGEAEAQAVALQEVFPENHDVYQAVLTDEFSESEQLPGDWDVNRVGWKCASTGGQCGDWGNDWHSGPLRVTGLTLSEGDSVRFEFRRQVLGNAQGVGTIHLNAAAVDLAADGEVPFATAEQTINLVSVSAAGLAFIQVPQGLDEPLYVNTPVEPAVQVAVVNTIGEPVTEHDVAEISLELYLEQVIEAGLSGTLSNDPYLVGRWQAEVVEGTGVASFAEAYSSECAEETECGPYLPNSTFHHENPLPLEGSYYFRACANAQGSAPASCGESGVFTWAENQGGFFAIRNEVP